MKKVFEDRLYGVENGFGMYATSFAFLPAEFIYDKDKLESLIDVINKCHIYFIGYLPRVDLVDAKQDADRLILTLSVLKELYDVVMDIPDGFEYGTSNGLHYLVNNSGQKIWPDENLMQQCLHLQHGVLTFSVKYIGQAYGKSGTRSALDRLLKHETLQKISLKGVPEGYCLSLLLLEVQENKQLFTVFNPFAQVQDGGSERIKAGLDKLFDTTEKEMVALYEAAFIRYFLPEYNKEFKDSFPSTNLKILQDCYEKDFSSVIAEICIDELPFHLISESIEAKPYHIARHNLHNDNLRNMFFGLD